MTYAISDIHGCYDEYIKLLDKIGFSDDDTLYIIGDICDRGPKPIEVYKDAMSRKNVHVILGNHDYMVLQNLVSLMCEEDSGTDDSVSVWTDNGGRTTIDGILRLSDDEIMQLIEYISGFSKYEYLTIQGKKYILVHTIPQDFSEDKSLDEYDFYQLLWGRPDYNKRYFRDENTFLITGHTPTRCIRSDGKYEVYKENGHIAIDCGCVYGGNLCAYCFEKDEVFYCSHD